MTVVMVSSSHFQHRSPSDDRRERVGRKLPGGRIALRRSPSDDSRDGLLFALPATSAVR